MEMESVNVNQFFSGPNLSLDKVFQFTPLAPRIQHHLSKVYLTLTLALGLVAVGATLLVLPQFLALIGLIGSGCALAFIPSTPANLTKRYGAMAAIAICKGSMIAPLMAMANYIDPSIVVTAIACTAAIFACFTVSALCTPRRSYIFLGGYLSSACLVLCLLSFSRIFVPSALSFSIELYLGLLVFSGYVLFDTQIVVEKAAAGDLDHIKHAVLLLTDVVAILVRIIVILMRNAQQKEEQQRKKQRRN